MTSDTLSPTRRKALKARAHRLNPVVMIGGKGLTDAVLREIDANLKSHELIKVKVASDERDERESYLARICGTLQAAPVQHIGKTLVLYRENPEALPVETAPPPTRKVAKKGSLNAGRPPAKAPARRPARTAPDKPRSPRRTRPTSGRSAPKR
jgi:putative YhbY family RNA-binding protein